MSLRLIKPANLPVSFPPAAKDEFPGALIPGDYTKPRRFPLGFSTFVVGGLTIAGWAFIFAAAREVLRWLGWWP